MANSAAITAHLRRQYPNPHPDPTWVTDCIAALIEDGQEASPRAVEEQYLWSNLGGSSASSIPPDVATRPILFPSPTLVQIHSLSEIGVSAFSLRSTLEQRRDVISGATRIRRLGDEEVEDSNAPPPYPRSMLSLEISDGRSAVRAIEYRSIPALVLGTTPLGTKLLLHNVPCRRGTRTWEATNMFTLTPVLLMPENCKVIGGAIEALEAEQPTLFVEGIEARLENARNGTAAGAAGVGGQRRRTLPIRRPQPQRAQPQSQQRANGTRSSAGAAARLAAIQAARAPDDIETFDDSDFEDDSFIQHVDAVEAAVRRQQDVIELLSD